MDRTYPGAKPNFSNQVDIILDNIREALQTGQLTQGKFLEQFENMVAEHCGVNHAAGVNSGGTALELVLRAVGVENREVIVPTNTFVATANAVIQAGGIPVFADVSRDTQCLFADDVAKRITANTAGIIFVHMFGLMPPDLRKISDLCKSRSLFLLEDAAHAHGASLDGKMAGAWGDAGCFSYYATKVITTGEGGMVTTSDKEIHEKVLQLRGHGKSLTEPVFEIPSNNYRLAEIPAILGIEQMKHLSDNVRTRNVIAAIYRDALNGVEKIELLPEFGDSYHSYWRFPAYLRKGVDRDEFQQTMKEKYGIRITWMYEPLCHLQPVFRTRLGHEVGDFPEAEKSIKRLICLPCYSSIDKDGAQYIAESCRMALT